MSTLPIRIRVVVGRDGSRAHSLHVFCPRERASIAPGICARCRFRCPPEEGPCAPAVGCTAGDDAPDEVGSCADAEGSLVYGPGAAAARICAGAASTPIVICVHADAPLGVVDPSVFPRAWPAYPVVDDREVLVGSVPGEVLASAVTDLASAFVCAHERMVPMVSVRESDYLSDAIGTMASHHLRSLPIVDAAGHVTGALLDLDLLRWVARGAPQRWR